MDQQTQMDGAARLRLGQELARLRNKLRMPQRELAARLFVERSYVSHAEKGRMVPARRFWESADRELGACGALVSLFEQLELSDPPDTPVANRNDSPSPPLYEPSTVSADLGGANWSSFGPSSQNRTEVILEQLGGWENSSRLAYVEPTELERSAELFLNSAGRRVFTLKGNAGCGKSRFTVEFAKKYRHLAYFQLHWINTLDLSESSLAEDILRYASLPAAQDALLSLERATAALDRTCLVLIDGLTAQDQVDALGVHLERVLRQICSQRLRFLLTVRTPPDVDLSSFPVLAASVYEPTSSRPGTSEVIQRWSARKAATAWSRTASNPSITFSDLPEALRALATIPLYLHLMLEADKVESITTVSSYRLIDHCVRSIISRSGSPSTQVHSDLTKVAARNLVELLPQRLQGGATSPSDSLIELPQTALAPLIETDQSGRSVFAHEVLSEYFVATHIAELIIEQGRGHTIVAALNELAELASTSATAHNVLEFTILGLDDRASDLLAVIALAPSAAIDTTLPSLLNAARHGARFASSTVIRHAASRCIEGDHRNLVRALLLLPTLADGLGAEYPRWLLNVIRTYGSSVWDEASQHLSEFPEFAGAQRLLSLADLNRSDDAVFVASHGALFGDVLLAPESGLLGELRAHLDWRVRAALVATLANELASVSTRHFAALAHDPDYKVRAAVAGAVGRVDGPPEQVRQLLADPNWHVRANLLQGALASADSEALATTVTDVIVSDPSWRRRPFHVGKLAERLSLLADVTVQDPDHQGTTEQRARLAALYMLLREIRSGFLRPSRDTRRRLVAQGLRSPDPLVVEVASQVAEGAEEPRSPREMFRRLRGRRSLQVALDLHDLDQAVSIAAAVDSEVDLIEVGDPLIKSAGLQAVTAIKRQVPEAWIVAEMMSADWGRDQVELAVEAGADAVLLIGPASIASVSAAVNAARRLDVPLVLDVVGARLTREWIRDMERAGVDGFTITTNIDLGVGARGPLDVARIVRGWSRLPVAVSGGFGVTDQTMARNQDWDITIVGRAVCDAVDPGKAAEQISSLIHHAD